MARNGPTMKDVAALAGVSLMAVSRVCNSDPGSSGQVSEAMRRKVMEAIETLGYHPNDLAQSLRRRRADTIGFYHGRRGLFLIADEFRRSLFTGLQDASTELAQDLLIFSVSEKARTVAEIVQELTTSRVDGLVFLAQPGDEELGERLVASHQNVVAIAEAVPGLPSVTAEDALGSRKIAEHLYDRGHRHVMYRRALAPLVCAERRYAAFRDAADKLGMRVTVTTATQADDAMDELERDLVRHARASGMTAIACWRDISAIQAILFCREIGLRIPEDIAVAGFDRLTPMICPSDIALTTVDVDWALVAHRAVAYLVHGRAAWDGLIEAGATEIAVDSPLFIGNTT